MEELKNEPKGIISEEALDQVAAGMDIDRATLRKAAKIAGIVVVSGAALTGAGIGGKALIDRRRSVPTNNRTSPESAPWPDTIPDPKFVPLPDPIPDPQSSEEQGINDIASGFNHDDSRFD